MTFNHSSALKHGSGMKLIPFSFRKPYVNFCKSIDSRLGNRSDEHIVSEHILASEVICLLAFRIVVIEWTAE